MSISDYVKLSLYDYNKLTALIKYEWWYVQWKMLAIIYNVNNFY